MKTSVFLLTLLLIFAGCRTVRKSSVRADSSSVKSDQSTEKFSRETITDYLVDSLFRPITVNVAAPKMEPGKTVILRQTVRESGEVQKDIKEEVKTTEVEKSKEASIPPLIQWAVFMFAGAFLLMAIAFFIKQFK